MGRAKKNFDPLRKKTERISIRLDPELRSRVEGFADSGVYKGEEIQVIVRMLLRAGLEVEGKVKEMRAQAIQELYRKRSTEVMGEASEEDPPVGKHTRRRA